MPKLNNGEGESGGRRRRTVPGLERGPVSREELRGLFAAVEPYEALYLAVSGGPDSLALMHLAADWLELRASDGAAVKFLCVLTVDHGLRPEAGEEARFVLARAGERGIAGEILRIAAPPPSTGIQEWARDQRYDALCERVAKDGRPAALLTGHHEGDVAETVLMRLARGSGVDGLARIAEVTARGGVAIVRPLLALAKARLVATLAARGSSWIEDPSNASRNFERVRLRQLAPERMALGLDDAALATTARRLRRAREALDAVTDIVIDGWLDRRRLETTGVFSWPWPVSRLPDEIGIRLLTRALAGVGGTRGRLRLARIERLYEELRSPGFAGATLGHCVIRPVQRLAEGQLDRQVAFEIYREPDRRPLPALATDFEQPVIWDNRFIIERCAPTGGRASVRAFERSDLAAVAGAEQAAEMQLDDALRATPVVEEADGGLWLAALDRYRPGAARGSVAGECPFRARFMIERLYPDATPSGFERKRGLAEVLEETRPRRLDGCG